MGQKNDQWGSLQSFERSMGKWMQLGQADATVERLAQRRQRLQDLLEQERATQLAELQGQQLSPAAQRKVLTQRAAQIEAQKETDRQRIATERTVVHMHENNADIQAATRAASARLVHEERQAQVGRYPWSCRRWSLYRNPWVV